MYGEALVSRMLNKWSKLTMKKINQLKQAKDLRLSKLREMVKDRDTWCAAVIGVMKSWT